MFGLVKASTLRKAEEDLKASEERVFDWEDVLYSSRWNVHNSEDNCAGRCR